MPLIRPRLLAAEQLGFGHTTCPSLAGGCSGEQFGLKIPAFSNRYIRLGIKAPYLVTVYLEEVHQRLHDFRDCPASAEQHENAVASEFEKVPMGVSKVACSYYWNIWRMSACDRTQA